MNSKSFYSAVKTRRINKVMPIKRPSFLAENWPNLFVLFGTFMFVVGIAFVGYFFEKANQLPEDSVETAQMSMMGDFSVGTMLMGIFIVLAAIVIRNRKWAKEDALKRQNKTDRKEPQKKSPTAACTCGVN